jgi:hypothetical protein
MLEKKLHEELMRYREINNYAKKMIMEQEVPPTDVPPPTDAPPMDPMAAPTDAPPMDPIAAPAPEMDNTEEIDITDLVNMTKNIKKEIDDNKQDHGSVLGQMDSIFTKLDDLESKLTQMDSVISKIDQLSSKIEQIKPKTPEEKLQMRSLDSYPFSQNPQQFFASKQGEMRSSGKNEYVLTKDEIENYHNDTIRDTFNPQEEEDEFKF